jgi:hypothetical protein
MTMINNIDNRINELKEPTNDPQKPVNESTGIYVRGFLKITDPESGEILVQTAD